MNMRKSDQKNTINIMQNIGFFTCLTSQYPKIFHYLSHNCIKVPIFKDSILHVYIFSSAGHQAEYLPFY